MEFDRKKPEVIHSIDILESLLPLLPNLLHLEIKAECIEVGTRSEALFGSLLSVKSVSTEPWDDEGFFNVHYFAFLASLPSLTDLTVYDWLSNTVAHFEEEEALQLPNIKTLRIEGGGADENSIKALVDLCPALLSVALNTTYDDDSTSYAGALQILPLTLRSLTLESGYAKIKPTDHLLFRFSQLRFLDLDKGCYSATIHTVLSHLPLLVDLRLGRGTIDPIGFLTLVSGPTRLVNLKLMILDLEAGAPGERLKQESFKASTLGDRMNDWVLSCDLRDGSETEENYVVNLSDLISVAEGNGVRIEGTVHAALKNFGDYWIESNNRSVLKMYFAHDTFDHLRYIGAKAAQVGLSLPQLDPDSLNPIRFELVKIDLPERNWYMYTLRSRGVVSRAEDVSGEGSS